MTDTAQKVLTVAVQYFGPAAKFFLQRQTKYHMNNLDAEELQPVHLPELVKWLKISAPLFIDKVKAEEFLQRVQKLISDDPSRSAGR